MTPLPPDTSPPEIVEEDILEAMKGTKGYVDITPGDFKVLYSLAYKHAVERLAHSVKAHEIMTRGVIFVHGDTALVKVAGIMAREGVSGVPVVDSERRVIGVISEKDFIYLMGEGHVRSFMGLVAHGLAGKKCFVSPMNLQKAEDIMTHPAVTVAEEASASTVINILSAHAINRLPVTDNEGRLVGIIARADIVRGSCTVVIPSHAKHGESA